jgi:hypothetical protein
MHDGELVVITDAHGVRWDYSPKRDHETLLPVIAERLVQRHEILNIEVSAMDTACVSYSWEGEVLDKNLIAHTGRGATPCEAIINACMAVLP